MSCRGRSFSARSTRKFFTFSGSLAILMSRMKAAWVGNPRISAFWNWKDSLKFYSVWWKSKRFNTSTVYGEIFTPVLFLLLKHPTSVDDFRTGQFLFFNFLEQKQNNVWANSKQGKLIYKGKRATTKNPTVRKYPCISILPPLMLSLYPCVNNLWAV